MIINVMLDSNDDGLMIGSDDDLMITDTFMLIIMILTLIIMRVSHDQSKSSFGYIFMTRIDDE